MKQVIMQRGQDLSGRQAELAFLRHQFEESSSGHLRVAFVAGEPGIGKTRLLDEVAQLAEPSGALVLRGGASEAEGMPPYLPFLQTLGQYILVTAPPLLREQTGSLASVLATILPELPLRLGVVQGSYPLPPEQARLRLYEAAGLFLAAIANHQPLLLLLDDLHWADSATLDLLCHIVRHQASARLLVLGAYRDGEVAQHVSFQKMLTELTRLRRLSTITIHPLPANEISTLATNMLGTSLSPTASALLSAQSEGNPFFAEELLQGWLESGLLIPNDTGFHLISSTNLTLPSSITNALRQRLNRLPSSVIDLLITAAIIGRSFDVILLAGVASLDTEEVESSLQEAVQAHLINPGPPGTFIFSHDTIRACLYAETGSVKRARLHALIGHTLERQLDSAQAVLEARYLENLVFHFAHSGERERTLHYAQLAAVSSLQSYAPEEAIAHYRTALILLDEYDPWRGIGLLGLGEAALLAGSFHDAIKAFGSALEWGRASGKNEEAGRAALGLGRAHWRLEEIRPARAALERAVALLPENAPSDRIHSLIELGSLLALSLHEHKEAAIFLNQALDLAQQHTDERLRVSASRALANLLLRTGETERATFLLEQALLNAEAGNDALESAEICASLALAYNWTGAFDRRDALLQRWLAEAQRCHDPYQLRHVYSYLATNYAIHGQRAEAEQILAQGLLIVEQIASPQSLAYLQWTQGMIAAFYGDYVIAEELIRTAIARFRALEPRSLVWWLGGLGFVLALQNKRQEISVCVKELEDLIIALPDETMPKIHAYCFIAAIAILLHDRETAAHLYPRLQPFRGQVHTFLMDRLLGELATQLADFSSAHDYLNTAEEITRRFALNAELSFTLVAQANLSIAEHSHTAWSLARGYLEEAATLFKRLGNQTMEQHTRERLYRLSRNGTRSRLPAGLSLREAEVLRLVVQGKSNREIAEILVISERTVANHVVHIFNKTGAENRAAAAAFAIRHELAE